MLERMYALKIPVCKILQEFDYRNLNEAEWQRVFELTKLLQPFEEATVMFSGSTYTTISMTHPIVHALLSHLREFKSTSSTILADIPSKKEISSWQPAREIC